MPAPLPGGRHRAGIGIGQGDLFVGRGLNLLANLPEGLHLPLQALDLLLEADCLCFGHIAVLPVGTVQDRQVARAMLASTCSMRLATLATVKFLSRLLTALNLLPSIAMIVRVKRLN